MKNVQKRKTLMYTSLSLYHVRFDLLIAFFLGHVKITTIRIQMNADPDRSINQMIQASRLAPASNVRRGN